ncbi:transcription elongation factor GreA [Pseudobacteriovorax antillogorgiicola]|uniref:Transcription elongation factor GreA n=1 Tax=Pseudobacteriovorax antillogorgiicola TaxID=1513793 RepID=A0A1Y6BCZ6_9BACT|nr:transcription elongation factor GreA [Pseudobacteriovorax antillogorgiicola]TCS58812.1 transcription elongation factor GreA [Pseudobacteriovorax antillogorgiicola]SME94413.1 transcription elongation factor GreA [Pseudobacteriovorax antillogorgiicola]
MTTETIPFTPQGYAQLKAELENLKSVQRPKVIEEIAEARAHGDLKENAEYHAAREKQSFIEGRITILDDHIARANVIDFSTDSPEKVMFGAFVSVEDEEGAEKTYRIVGDLEADISENKISTGSPIAKALMGKSLDDVVEVKVPKGVVEYTITKISY